MTVKVGAVSADAIAQISDTVFWCGSTPQGGLSIFQYDGNLNRISTPEVDAIMILAGASNISLTTIRFYGRSSVIVIASTTTLVYCVEEKMWHEWSSTVPLWYKCAGVSVGGTMVNYTVTNLSTGGKVYIQNHATLVFTDDSVAYTATMQMPPMDLGTNRYKFWDEIDIIGDQETTSSNLTISYSDDDYQTYTALGTVDLSGSLKRLTRGGMSKRRAWKLTHSAETPMRLEALEGRVRIGR